MTPQPAPHRMLLRLLAALLSYPDTAFYAALPRLAFMLRRTHSLCSDRLLELHALVGRLAATDPLEAEARYVDTFDRGRSTSLHLFEHVHGDSRERGPAMVDLRLTYERAGLHLIGGELPDHLCVALEFASTQPPEVAREFLGEIAHVLQAIFSALRQRGSPYASVLAAVLEVAGRKVEAVPVADEPPVDEAWAEPPAFDGCSTRGQAAPGAPQPIRIVRHATQGAPS